MINDTFPVPLRLELFRLPPLRALPATAGSVSTMSVQAGFTVPDAGPLLSKSDRLSTLVESYKEMCASGTAAC